MHRGVCGAAEIVRISTQHTDIAASHHIFAVSHKEVDGLAERFCAELGPQTAFYATGSLPAAIREACRTPILYRETLITDGLYRIWMKNKKG